MLLHIIGCGTGNFTVPLSGYVGKVTGLEVNEGMLGRAMEKTAALNNVSLTQGDITKMPFQDNQFDGICCNLVSYYLALNYCSMQIWLQLQAKSFNFKLFPMLTSRLTCKVK